MPLDAVQLAHVLPLGEVHAVEVGWTTGIKPPTPSEHEGTLAHAVVIVHVLGAEVCSMDYQAALSACGPTVALQEQPVVVFLTADMKTVVE